MKKLLFLVAPLLLFTQINAQDVVVSDTTMTYLDLIEVTGVRADKITPITQKTVNRDEIQSTYQGQEMSYVLSNTPSVVANTDGGHPQGYTYFRMRGIDQTRMNMTLNGVPLNEPEDQGVYFSNYPGFANNIQSMQIQRGVGTSTNGVSSYAGSINFESPSGIDTIKEIQLGYGSFNTKRFSITNSTGKSKKGFALYSNFSTLETDGYKYNSGSFGYSAFLSGGYYGNKDIVKITAFSGRSFNQMAWFAVSETDIKNDPRTNYNTPRENDDFMQSFIQAQHSRDLSLYSTLTTTAYYNRLDGNWDLDLNPLGGGNTVLNYGLGSNFYGAMTNYQYKRNGFRLNFGLHTNSYQRNHNLSMLPSTDTLFYENTGTKNESSSYLKMSYDVNDFTLFVDGQARYVSFKYKGGVNMDDVNWFFLNPKGGIRYNHSDKLSYYASVGKANREPTRTDMFGGEDDLIRFNNITPEQVIDYELGMNFENKKFKIQTNLFYMDFKNEITLLGVLGNNGLPLMANVSQSFRSGIELDGVYQINKNLSLTNNSSYSYNRITDNGNQFQPLYTPNLIVNQGVNYKYKNFGIGVSGKYHSESYIDFDNTAVTPSFLIFNSNLSYNYKNSTLMLQVNNLTNQSYYTNGYAVAGERYFFVNAPRSFYVTYKFNF